MSAESGESEGAGPEEQASPTPVQASYSEPTTGMPVAEATEVSGEAPTAPQPEGRRTQFRIVRESIQNLSIEVGRYRKSHEASAKRLEAQVSALRKDLATHVHSKDLAVHAKSHVSDTKRLENQIATLRSELASLKGQMAKEAAKGRAREEAALSRIISKVRAPKPAKKPKQKTSKKKR